MTDVTTVLDDLVAEQDALDQILAPLESDAWSRPTASDGWSVADQIGHLAYFDRAAALAISDADRFAVLRDALLSTFAGDVGAADRLTLESARGMSAADLLDHWRSGRRMLSDAARTLGEKDRVEWYGPSMGSKSFLTARLMECWAHGQDVVDAVGGERAATDRLRHIAQLGVITRKWSYINRGEEPPDDEVRICLTAPSGGEWTWGDDDAESAVTGDAEDFCLVVTQRRHVDDTGLEVSGEAARSWLERAQAFAGPATDGPSPRA